MPSRCVLFARGAGRIFLGNLVERRGRPAQRSVSRAGDGASTPGWTETFLDSTSYEALSLAAADIDGDGDVDVLAGKLDAKLFLYENDGGFAGSGTLLTNAGTAYSIHNPATLEALDLDQDGDVDVLTAASGPSVNEEVYWFENECDTHAPTFSPAPTTAAPSWSPPTPRPTVHCAGVALAGKVVASASELDGVRSVRAADVDGDQDYDAIYAVQDQNKVGWIQYDEDHYADSLITIDGSLVSPMEVWPADVDGAAPRRDRPPRVRPGRSPERCAGGRSRTFSTERFGPRPNATKKRRFRSLAPRGARFLQGETRSTQATRTSTRSRSARATMRVPPARSCGTRTRPAATFPRAPASASRR